MKRSGSAPAEEETVELPSRDNDSSQAFSLPGVPMKYMPPQARAKALPPAEAAPAPKPAPAPEAAPAEKPAAAAPALAGSADQAGGDLEYHINAAKKYAFKKKYKSAAAEYGAAIPFLPAGDARAVYLLERQGAMLLRVGSEPKAQEAFAAAIKKAAELKTAGKDLANAHLGLGYCLEKKNNIPEAIKNYEKAAALSPGKKAKARIAKTISDLKAAKK
ncbi:MAG TPA: hypothetical protein DEQ38_12940 [Elusimicrobia bacterium]|nr:hypothetical protein [Elusimicrobiota bacterium]